MQQITSNHHIREARQTDIPQITHLLHDLFSIEADFQSDPAKQQRALQLMLQRPQQCALFVAEHGGEVVAFCSVQTTISTAEGGEAALVEDVIVAAGHRGQGLGRQLLQTVEAWCGARGIRRLQLLADAENHPSHHFYQALGWGFTQLRVLRRQLPGD